MKMASDKDKTEDKPEKVKLAEAKMIAERDEFAKYLTQESQHDLKIITTGICEFLSWFGFTDEVCYLKAAEFIKYKRKKGIGDLIKRFWGN